MQSIDTLILPKWLIPVVPDGVLTDHALAIHKGRILAVGPAAELAESYKAAETIKRPNHALIPGLINAHTHAAMSLLRGYADDLPLMEWLQEHIWPAEQAHVNADFVALGSELAIAEMLRGGTTCFNDMYLFPEVTAEVAIRTGIRAGIGLVVFDQPTIWAKDADEYLKRGQQVRAALREEPLITTLLAPHAPYTNSDATLKKLLEITEAEPCRIHMHIHETAFEVASSIENSGQRPLQRLNDLGLLNDRLLAVHMTQLLPEEIELLKERGVMVAHCPQSNLKLASGLCPTTALHEAGVRVAIGTDGAASNNDLDMLEELRTAALLAKGQSGNPQAWSAPTSLRAATLDGAAALGLEDQIGSIEPGKQADMAALDLSAPACQPMHQPLSQIVYSASRGEVTDTWVAGRALLRDRALTTIDESDCLARVSTFAEKLRRAGS